MAKLQQQRKIKNPPYIYGEEVVGVDKYKSSVLLDRPIYVGMTILDLAKLVMYRYWYDYLLKRYDASKVSLLFTDTDSFCYSVETEDVYQDMLDDMKGNDASRHYFDFSNYPKTHPNYDTRNEKVLEKMKDETKGVPIKSFVGHRSKMYSCEVDAKNEWFKKKDGDHKATAKGIKTYRLKRIEHKEYKDELFNLIKAATTDNSEKYQPHKVSFNTIKSTNHQLHTVRQTKAGLCAFDDKSYICDDGITQLRYGHHKISE